jgi:hypothetical protein
VAWVKVGLKYIFWQVATAKKIHKGGIKFFSTLKKQHGQLVSGIFRSGLLACQFGHGHLPKTVCLYGFWLILTQATLDGHHGQGKSEKKIVQNSIDGQWPSVSRDMRPEPVSQISVI